jgi:hypothetical protein
MTWRLQRVFTSRLPSRRLLDRRLLTRSLPWVASAVAAAVAASRSAPAAGDTSIFVWAGRTLLSAHWSHTYAYPTIQAGPLQLGLFGSVGHSPEALAIVLGPATALLVVTAARVTGVENAVLLTGVGLFSVLAGFTTAAYSVGHPADAVLPLLWIIAAAEARRGRVWQAGLLVGLSAGLETWGILGVAVLALAPRRRQARAGTLVAAATAAALFLPFVLGGHFAMFSFHWQVQPPSPLSLLVPEGTPFGWPLRLAQGVLAVGAGVAVSRLLRHSPHALWAAPLAIVVTRLQLDPLLFTYYLSAPQGPIMVGAALGASRLGLLRGGAAATAVSAPR